MSLIVFNIIICQRRMRITSSYSKGSKRDGREVLFGRLNKHPQSLPPMQTPTSVNQTATTMVISKQGIALPKIQVLKSKSSPLILLRLVPCLQTMTIISSRATTILSRKRGKIRLARVAASVVAGSRIQFSSGTLLDLIINFME